MLVFSLVNIACDFVEAEGHLMQLTNQFDMILQLFFVFFNNVSYYLSL